MGWKQYVRAMENANRRIERAAARQYYRWTQEQKRLQNEEDKQEAAGDVAEYEAYLALLTSLDTECGPALDWPSVLRMPPPLMPQHLSRREPAARAALVAFQPGPAIGRMTPADWQEWQSDAAVCPAIGRMTPADCG